MVGSSRAYPSLMRAFLVVACACVVVAVAQASPPRNGLYGTVTRGPVTPMCVAEQPCSEPAAGVVLQFWVGGRLAGRAVSRADGRYRIALPVGVYTIRAASGRLDPVKAAVRALRFRRVDLAIDTGIR